MEIPALLVLCSEHTHYCVSGHLEMSSFVPCYLYCDRFLTIFSTRTGQYIVYFFLTFAVLILMTLLAKWFEALGKVYRFTPPNPEAWKGFVMRGQGKSSGHSSHGSQAATVYMMYSATRAPAVCWAPSRQLCMFPKPRPCPEERLRYANECPKNH